MDYQTLEKEVAIKKLKVSILKAKANLEEYEQKKLERMLDIARIDKEIEAQGKVIEDSKLKLIELGIEDVDKL